MCTKFYAKIIIFQELWRGAIMPPLPIVGEKKVILNRVKEKLSNILSSIAR